MAAEPEKFAPYASLGSIITVIDQLRNKGMPDQVTPGWLGMLGLTESIHPRVLQTLRFLNLIDKDDRKTPEADALRTANPNDYPGVLGQTVMRSYHRIFQAIDPADALDDDKLRNAFWDSEPTPMRDRMKSLFVGLLKEARLIPGEVTRGGPVRRSTERREPAKAATGNGENPGQPPPPPYRPSPPPAHTDYLKLTDARYELLHAALRQLPPDGMWTKARRDRWLAAITANLDLLVEISEEQPQASAQPSDIREQV